MLQVGSIDQTSLSQEKASLWQSAQQPRKAIDIRRNLQKRPGNATVSNRQVTSKPSHQIVNNIINENNKSQQNQDLDVAGKINEFQALEQLVRNAQESQRQN